MKLEQWEKCEICLNYLDGVSPIIISGFPCFHTPCGHNAFKVWYEDSCLQEPSSPCLMWRRHAWNQHNKYLTLTLIPNKGHSWSEAFSILFILQGYKVGKKKPFQLSSEQAFMERVCSFKVGSCSVLSFPGPFIIEEWEQEQAARDDSRAIVRAILGWQMLWVCRIQCDTMQ